MKQNQKDQQGKNTKAGDKKNQGRAEKSSGNIRKNEDLSSGDTPEEPIPPSTPRREYEDPGHEHVYQPPTANPPTQATPEFIGEG
ncbi:MAG TPA: hypothetical protein VGK10_02000 [Prolixibacteraceae bacterium]|jgi:hypothetical protein